MWSIGQLHERTQILPSKLLKLSPEELHENIDFFNQYEPIKAERLESEKLNRGNAMHNNFTELKQQKKEMDERIAKESN